MQIVIVLPDLRGGGAERIRLDLAHEFQKRGHKVRFVLMRARGEFLDEAVASFEVVDLKLDRFRQVPLALAKYLRSEKPDAVMAAMWPLTVVCPLAAKLARHRCRVLVSEHGIISAQYRDRGKLHYFFLRFSTAIGYRLANARIGVSAGVVADISRLSLLPIDAFHVISNPVPPRSTPTDEAIAEAERMWEVPRGARILAVGRLKPVKNFSLLIRAFARLNNPNGRLMLVGDGQERQQLGALVHELSLENRVIFAGFQADPTPFYQTADLFALSSNYEGFGNVIVEAMSCGTSVLATDCPAGPAEILKDGKYGKLVPVGDEKEFAAGIELALRAPTAREILKGRSRDFLPEKAADKYLELLTSTQKT